MDSFENRNIYMDILNELIGFGHNVDVMCPMNDNNKNAFNKKELNRILPVKVGAIEKTTLIKKGINTVLLEKRYLRSLKKNLTNENYDLVIYSTPPISFGKVVKYVKRQTGAFSYLMLKDIFPQNALDLELLSRSGLKGIIYKYFRSKEIKLYKMSDYIGCMSEANIKYVINNNPFLDKEKVGLCPNSIRIEETVDNDITDLRKQLCLPIEKKIIVYGGNLGLPQNIDFFIDVLKRFKGNEEIMFLVIGSGTMFERLNDYVQTTNNQAIRLLSQVSKELYNKYVEASDIGMILLDHRFTIPNFPSRLLSYMELKKPVFCSVDLNTDVGVFVEQNNFGVSSLNGDGEDFVNKLNTILSLDLKTLGQNSRRVLERKFNSKSTARNILEKVKKGDRYV